MVRRHSGHEIPPHGDKDRKRLLGCQVAGPSECSHSLPGLADYSHDKPSRPLFCFREWRGNRH